MESGLPLAILPQRIYLHHPEAIVRAKFLNLPLTYTESPPARASDPKKEFALAISPVLKRNRRKAHCLSGLRQAVGLDSP
jgi:hypothetical protein